MVKPAEMSKISVTGPKKQLRTVINTLYELELLDIQDYDGELETGEPLEEGEELSKILVDVRSLLSKLPETDIERGVSFSLEELEDELDEVNVDIEKLEDEINDQEKHISDLESQKQFFHQLQGAEVDYEDLNGTNSLEVFVGDIDTEKFREDVSGQSYEIEEGQDLTVIFYREGDKEVGGAVRKHGRAVNVPETDLTGSPSSLIDKLETEIEEAKEEKEALLDRKQELADRWRPRLEDAENFLTEKVEKAEAPISFATMKRSFLVEGWVPKPELEDLRDKLEKATNGEIHLEEEEFEGEPPVKHDNNRAVQPFESLTDLVSVPKYNELDPSFVLLLTFPALFGFMIGDAGYGLTTLAVFYGGYRMFPQAADIFKSLMFASVATIIFGLAFGDAFGYVIFGHHSELAKVTGIHLFEQIPILFHRAEHLGQVFTIAALFGAFHINLGYLLGAYNEYVKHGIKEAFLEKGSWIMLEIGALLAYFVSPAAGIPVILISIISLYVGEGVEGVVEIPSLLSNILSYLRIFGVAVAAVSLAAVVNSIAEPLFGMGTVGLVLGIGALALGHIFNTFIKIMEGFLQGIRLHYVEMFGKFYEGGGKKYSPFGAKTR